MYIVGFFKKSIAAQFRLAKLHLNDSRLLE